MAVVVLVAALVVLAGGGWWWAKHRAADTAATGASGAPAGGAARGPGGGGRRFAGAGGAPVAQPVSVAQVRQQDMRVLLLAIGTVTAQNTAIVRAKADGELRTIRFKEGDTVRAGQLLAEIDPRSYQAALGQAQGALARDQALLRNAQIDLQRYQDLLAQDSIAQQQVDTQAALVRQTQGTVQADQAAVDAAKLTLSYTQVTAPIAGRLGLKQADLGNVVHAADTNGIVTITQTQPINTLFSVPEQNLQQIARKVRAGQTLVVEAWDRDKRRKLATGQVNFIDNAIDATTGTIKVKAVFPNTDNALFPNQFVNVVLQVDTLHDALAVPTAAIQRGTQGIYVYAVNDDGTVAVRKITLGPVEGDWTSVTGELKAGDKVVTDGADRLREGAKVEVIVPPTTETDAAAAEAQSRQRGLLQRLPSEEREKLRAMSPEDRRAYLQKLRAAPGGQAGAAGAPGAAPAAGAPGAGVPAGQQGNGGDREARQARALDGLPPEQRAKVEAMSPEDRRAYFQKLREQREQQRGQGAGGPGAAGAATPAAPAN